MIWQNPWAWLGLLTVALPVLIHLLARRSARVQPFPTLRFLDTSRLLPTRRTRLQDVLLLSLRVTILAAAVSALAQPLFPARRQARDSSRALARVVVVDTSLSMMRRTRTGERALDAARREARALEGADLNVLLETVSPARALAGAVAWLGNQPARREVVIVSDFQLGTIEPTDLANLPKDVGVRLQRIDATADSVTGESVSMHGPVETVARSTFADSGTTVEWSYRPSTKEHHDLRILAGSTEREKADAALMAARTIAYARSDTARPVIIVQPGYERRAELLSQAKGIDQPWMADVVARLRRDSFLALTAADAAVLLSTTGDSLRLVTVARTDSGRAVAFAASGPVDGRASLLIFSLVDAGSTASAALLAATANALGGHVPVRELEQRQLSADALARWHRPTPATGLRLPAANDASDARWFWLLVLALLIAEGWLRRRMRQQPREQTPIDSVHELVA
jgi:aerotolerance regulator-like protein